MYFPKVPTDGSYTSLTFLIWFPKKRKLLQSHWPVFQSRKSFLITFELTSWFKLKLGIKVSKIIKFLRVLYKSLSVLQGEAGIAGPSIGNVVITQPWDTAVELVSWLTNIPALATRHAHSFRHAELCTNAASFLVGMYREGARGDKEFRKYMTEICKTKDFQFYYSKLSFFLL